MKPPPLQLCDDQHAKYVCRIEYIALKYFNETFKPWLDKHGLSLTTGMGTWFVVSLHSGRVIDMERMLKFKHIYEDLEMEIPGTSNPFGAFMPNYAGNRFEEENTHG